MNFVEKRGGGGARRKIIIIQLILSCYLSSFLLQASLVRRLIPGGLGRNSAIFRHVGEGFAVRVLAKMARHPVSVVRGQVSEKCARICDTYVDTRYI